MFTLKRVSSAAVVIAVLAFSMPANADSNPEALKLAKEIMEVNHASDRGDQIMTVLMKTMTTTLAATNPGKAKEVEEILNNTLLPELRNSLPDLLEQTAHTYADNFTVDDLKQILAFYRSDIGKKLVDRQPEMIRQQALIGQKYAQAVLGRIRDKMLKALQEKGLQKPQGI
jgi:hypothetical protein